MSWFETVISTIIVVIAVIMASFALVIIPSKFVDVEENTMKEALAYSEFNFIIHACFGYTINLNSLETCIKNLDIPVKVEIIDRFRNENYEFKNGKFSETEQSREEVFAYPMKSGNDVYPVRVTLYYKLE